MLARWREAIVTAFDEAPFAAGAGAVGVAGLLVGLLVSLLAPEIQSTGAGLSWVSLALVAVAVLERVARTRSTVGRRRRRYGIAVGTTLTAFAVLIIALNALIGAIDVRFDLTAARQFTLAGQTASVLGRMETDVEAIAFFVDRFDGADPVQTALRNRVEDLLREFERTAAGRFSYRFVDPEIEPLAALNLGVTRYPAVVFDAPEAGLRHTALASSNVEQSFLTGLLIATGGAQKTVYVLTGHRELAPEDGVVTSTRGFAVAADGLRNDAFKVSELNLLSTGAVPEEAAVLVVPGPLDALVASEEEALDAYLVGGGQVLIAVEPESDRSWAAWLSRWGINVPEGYVLDFASHVAGTPGIPLLTRAQYQAPYITAGLDSTFFPGLAPLGFVADPSVIPNLVDFDLLGLTTPNSFVAPALTQTTPDEESDIHPYLVGVLVRSVGPVDKPPPGIGEAQLATLAVFGDGEFFSNRFFGAVSNGDLFLNVVNELAGDVPLVPVRAKPLEFRGLVLTDQQFTLVRALGWFALPVLLSAGAVVAWLRRR